MKNIIPHIPIKSTKLILALLIGMFIISNSNLFGQTLIDPNGDGGFENATSTFAANGWTPIGTTAPTWYVGTAGGAQSGTQAAFIGTGPATFGSSATARVSHFYRDVVIPSGATNVSLSFYLKFPVIDNTYDFLYIYRTTTTNTPVDGTVPGAGYTQIFSYTTPVLASFTAQPAIDLTSLAGTTIRLVFTFKNDGVAPNAYFAVDNISLTYTPPDPNNLIQTYTSSSYFTVPEGVTSITAECWGGGGGGGGNTNSQDGGGGGGGGAYSKANSISVTPNTTYAVNVGTGGYQYTTAEDIQAYSGGDSWFNDATTVLAKGGTGGYNADVSGNLPGAGGIGGAAGSGIGDVKWTGGNGSIGNNASAGTGGGGGSSAGTAANGVAGVITAGGVAPAGGGNGGNGGAVGVSGTNGFVPGGGGGGSGELAYGGDGATGKVVIYYTCITITTQPSNQTLCSGGSADFTVVSSAPSLTYQWKYNGTAVSNGTPANAVYSGANTATLNISGAIAAGSYANYTCTLSNSCGSTTSSAVTLTVSATAAPANPANPTAAALGCDVILTCTGTPPIGQTWYWQGTSCGINTTLGSGVNYTASTSGTYSIRSYLTVPGCWSVGCGSVAVSALDKPTIITNPTSATTGCNGTPVTFTVVTSGAGLVYKWQEYIVGWLDITDGGVYSGSSTEILTISNPAGLSGRQYRCKVTGSCLPDAYSTAATLTVLGTGLSGIITVPSVTYPTLKSAFDAINLNGLTGNLEIQITNSILDNNEAILNSSATCGDMGYTINIYPTGIGPWTLSGTVPLTSLITLNGADNVTFNGKLNQTGVANNLILSNLSTTGSTLKFINDATYNTVKYCTLLGVSTAATTGVIHFSTALTSGNDYNTINNCVIKDGATTPRICIYSNGTFGKENDNNVISNCDIYNFFASNLVGYGIRISVGNTKWTISGNSLYQTAATRSAGDFYGIYIVNSLGGEFIIDGNYIGGRLTSCGGGALTYTDGGYSPYFRGIYLDCSTSGISYIKNNVIKNINFGTSPYSNNDFLFFPIMTAGGRIDITGNTIGDGSTTNSIILNITDKSTYSSVNMGIYKEGDGSVLNNNIGSISISGTSGDACIFYGIQITGTLISDALVSGNTIGGSIANNIQCAATPALNFCGILFGTDGNYRTTVSNNLIANITSNSTGTIPWIMCMDNEASGGTQVIVGNTIRNISSVCTNLNGNNASSIVGISSMNTTTGGHTVTGNTIHSFTSTGAAAVNVFGIICYHAGAATAINNNFIHSFNTTSNTAVQTGIKIYSGPGNFSNNMIRLGIDASGTSVSSSPLIRGLWQYTTDPCNFYFNSVYIGGNCTVNNAINTYAFARDQNATTNIKNNIFYNARTKTLGTHKDFAIATNSTTIASTDYNDLFTVVAGTNLGTYDYPLTCTSRDFTAWQNLVRDLNSKNLDPVFISPTTATPNLHINTGLAWPNTVIGTGIIGTGILVDYDNEVREAGVSPNGPCIGADEKIAPPPGMNAYGIYSPTALGGTVADCEIYATGGAGGGIGYQVAIPTDANYANIYVSTYQNITVDNITCTGTNINYTTTDGSPDWLLGNGSNPSSGTTTPIVTQYSSLGRKDIIESVKVFKDFTNLTMSVPSPGTILGAPAGAGCPTTYSYTSSVAGSPGYTYLWSSTLPGGCYTTISNPTSSTTNVTFENLTGVNQVFVLNLQITTECCGPLTLVKRYITIYPSPAAPVVIGSPFTLCTGGTQSFSVDVTDPTYSPSYSYEWYNASSGGSLIGTGITYTVNPVLTGSNSYWVQATNSFGCTSTRTEVVVIGNDTPPPTLTGNSTCGAGDVTLTITPVAGIYTYNWYSGSCLGTLEQSSSSTSFTTTIAATTTYYVSAIPFGCGESACNPVTATFITPTDPIVWLGVSAGLNNWFTPSNWTDGCLPNCNTNVQIVPNGGTVICQPDIGFNAMANAACKNIDLTNGAVLSFSDTKAVLDVCGNFIHAGTLTTNDLGEINFISSLVAQQYIKTTGTGYFNNVGINNTSGTPTVTLNGGNMVLGPNPGTTGILDLQSGTIVTAANYVILNSTDPTAVNAGSSISYINGNIRRYITTNTGTYYFPVGISSRYTLAELINNNLTNVSYIDSRFMTPFTGSSPLNPAIAIDNGTPYNSVSTEGVWVLDATLSGAIGGNYSIKLWFDGGGSNLFAGLTDNMFGPLKRTSGSVLSTDWTALGGTINASGTPGRTVASGYAQRTGWSSFSEYAIGLSLIPLPIELVSFEGYCRDTYVELKWSTSQEINNDYFTLERSYDGENWEFVTKINGAGNSNELKNYNYSDKMVYGHIIYYRLSQTDKNGLNNTFKMISTYCSGKDKPVSIYIYPNPANDQLNVIIESTEFDSGNLLIVDDLGRSLLKNPVSLAGEKGKYIIDLTDLSSGSYYLKCVFNKTLLPVQKFIIQKK